MSKLLTRAISVAIQADVPIHIIGAPGTGKTSVIYAMAQQLGMPLEVVIASVREPSDFAGLPVVTKDGVRFAPPRWANAHAEDIKPWIVFLDEGSTAPPAVQASMLRVVLDKWVGDLQIPTARFVMASNPVEQAAGGWDLSAPMANRFCHLEWTVDKEGWLQGMISGFDISDLVHQLGESWQDTLWPAKKVLVASFIRTKAHLLLSVPKDESKAGGPWPSPRTWTMASKLMAAAEGAHCDGDVTLMLLAGCIGVGPATEFLNFVKNLDLPDPEELLKNPALFHPGDLRDDQLFTIINGVISATINNLTKDRWIAAWSIMTKTAKEKGSADIAAGSVGALLRKRKSDFPLSEKDVKDFLPLIKMSGL